MSLHFLSINYVDGYYTEHHSIHNERWTEEKSIKDRVIYIFDDEGKTCDFESDINRAKDSVMKLLENSPKLLKDEPLYYLIALEIENYGYKLINDTFENHVLNLGDKEIERRRL